MPITSLELELRSTPVLGSNFQAPSRFSARGPEREKRNPCADVHLFLIKMSMDFDWKRFRIDRFGTISTRFRLLLDRIRLFLRCSRRWGRAPTAWCALRGPRAQDVLQKCGDLHEISRDFHRFFYRFHSSFIVFRSFLIVAFDFRG